MDKGLRDRFAGIDRLYGAGAVQRLAGRHVAVVGLGGLVVLLIAALVIKYAISL